MAHPRRLAFFASIAFGFVLTLSGPAAAFGQEPPPTDKWVFRLTPYLWVPSIDGSSRFDLPGDGIDAVLPIGPDDYVGNLEFGFLGTLEARRGDWSILTDVLYLDLGADRGRVTAPIVPGGPGVEIDAETEFSAFIGHLVVGRTVVRSPKSTLDVFGGIRYAAIQTEAELSLGDPLPPTLPGTELEADTNVLDGIVGVRGRLVLGKKWFAPYYLDIGTGASQFSWQAIAGAGYSLKWGDILLVYRHLDIQPDDKPLEDLSLSGFALGVGFKL